MPAEPWLNSDWLDAPSRPLFESFDAQGFAYLPNVATPSAVAALRERADDLLLGRVDHRPFFYQRDADNGVWDDAPLGVGWTGPTPRYRKLEKLERDPVMFRWLTNPLFERLAREAAERAGHPDTAGRGLPVYRAILMNKAARDADGGTGGGTDLPWHQDGGQLWGLARDPLIQFWLALDDATEASGAMRFAVGSHKAGLASRLGGVVPPAHVAAHIGPEADPGVAFPAVSVSARPGDVVMLHNLVWHASGRNDTPLPRRAISVCFLDPDNGCARTRKAPRSFPRVFGK